MCICILQTVPRFGALVGQVNLQVVNLYSTLQTDLDCFTGGARTLVHLHLAGYSEMVHNASERHMCSDSVIPLSNTPRSLLHPYPPHPLRPECTRRALVHLWPAPLAYAFTHSHVQHRRFALRLGLLHQRAKQAGRPAQHPLRPQLLHVHSLCAK